MTIPWLTILALLPAVGAVVLIFTGAKIAKQVALVVSLLTLVFASSDRQPVHDRRRHAVRRTGALDQAARGVLRARSGWIGLTLVLLVVIVTPVVIIASWRDFDAAGSRTPEPVEGAGR